MKRVSKVNLFQKESLLIILLGLIIYNIFFFILSDTLLLSLGKDDASYIEAAKQLWYQHSFHPIRPIGLPLLSGIPLLLAKSTEGIIGTFMIINIVLWLFTFLLIYKTLLIQTNRKNLALAGSILFSLGISTVSYTFVVLSETLYIFTLTLLVYQLCLFFKTKSYNHLVLAITILVFSCLIKPVSWYLVFVGIVTVVIFFRRIKTAKKRYVIVLILAIGCLAIQLISIKNTYGNYSLSYTDKVTWYYYLGAQSKAKKLNKEYTEERTERLTSYENLPWKEKASIASSDLSEQIKNNTLNVLKCHTNNVITSSNSGNALIKYHIQNSTAPNTIIKRFYVLSSYQNRAYFFLLLFNIILLLTFSFKRRRITAYPFQLSVLLLAIYFYITAGISFTQGDRLLIIAQPLLLISSISLLTPLFRRIQ